MKFEEDQDRGVFVARLGQACEKTGWEVHAHALMPKHFHLVVESPRANLVAGKKWLFDDLELDCITAGYANCQHG